MLWRSGGGRLLHEMLRYGADKVGCNVDELHILLEVIVQPQRFRGCLLLMFSSEALCYPERYLISIGLRACIDAYPVSVFPQSPSQRQYKSRSIREAELLEFQLWHLGQYDRAPAAK